MKKKYIYKYIFHSLSIFSEISSLMRSRRKDYRKIFQILRKELQYCQKFWQHNLLELLCIKCPYGRWSFQDLLKDFQIIFPHYLIWCSAPEALQVFSLVGVCKYMTVITDQLCKSISRRSQNYNYWLLIKWEVDCIFSYS